MRSAIAVSLVPVLSLILGVNAVAEPSGDVRLKVLTWNVQLLPEAFDTFSSSLRKMQSARVPWIVEYLNAQDYDVVCLQEVIDPLITEALMEALKPVYPHQVAPQTQTGERLLSSGVLFVSRVPIKLVAFSAYEHSAGIDAITSKGATLVEGEKDGVRFQAGGTHMQAGHQDMKDRQYVEAAEKVLKPHRREGVPQFFVGDFNTEKGTEKYDILLKTLDMRDYPMDDPVPLSVDGENSWNSPNHRGGLIDHIFLWTGGTGSGIVKQWIQRARREHEGRVIDLADHYGVVAEAVISNK